MPTIALFLHQPKCSVESTNGIIQALSPKYRVKIFTRFELEDGFFNDVDIVAFPGGIGDADSHSWLFRNNGDTIRKFVQNGGRYLGICMGAYWAGKHYFNLLDGVDAVQYITRPGTDTRRPHAKNISISWKGEPMNMYWYDGCALVGKGPHEVVATYANGDAMAIYQGRIGLIGCHPESTPHWYNSCSWMKPYFHNYEHHKLLLDFVDELMKK
jgi:hypothetical protein